MSFSLTVFGPRHFWWNEFKQKRSWRKYNRVWFYRPDAHSTGGIGFCLPGIHVCLTWGKEKRK